MWLSGGMTGDSAFSVSFIAKCCEVLLRLVVMYFHVKFDLFRCFQVVTGYADCGARCPFVGVGVERWPFLGVQVE